MSTYRRKPAEVEARRWTGNFVTGGVKPAEPLRAHAESIVAWVNASGGEARFEPACRDYPHGNELDETHQPLIGLRTLRGWAFAAPGHYVVIGSDTFEVGSPDPCDNDPLHKVRNFYPCDPATFEQRWEPAS